MNVDNTGTKDKARPVVLLRANQATFTDCSNDTISNRDIVGFQLTGESVNNQRTANYQVVYSGRSSEISLANMVGSVAQSAKPNDTF